MVDHVNQAMKKHGTGCAVLCGDFNSLPDSHVYRMLTTGEVASGFGEHLSGDWVRQAVDPLFTSAYAAASAGGVDPSFTNFASIGQPPTNSGEGARAGGGRVKTAKSAAPKPAARVDHFKGCLDYIFYANARHPRAGASVGGPSAYIEPVRARLPHVDALNALAQDGPLPLLPRDDAEWTNWNIAQRLRETASTTDAERNGLTTPDDIPAFQFMPSDHVPVLCDLALVAH